jgi:hypothetical protein
MWNHMTKTVQDNSGSLCLGIESSADDFGVGIATFGGDILANKSDDYPNRAEFTQGKLQGTMLK